MHIFGVALFGMLVSSGQVVASKPTAPVTSSLCSAEAKVGVVAGWPPLTSVSEAGVAEGLDIEIAKMVFKQAGICIEFVRLPSAARSFAQLTKGVVDVVLMVSYTFKRKQWGLFTLPYRTERMRLFSLKPPDSVYSLRALLSAETTIGLSIGSYYGEEIKSLANNERFGNQFIGISTIQRRIELLAKERVDFIIEDEIVGNYLTQKYSNKPIYIWAYPVHDNEVHFLLRKDKFTPAQRRYIDQAIVALRPSIQNLVEQYRKQQPSPD
ncbi:substrate-binding periplasmic protein [Pseudoalteromonas luteoviolacea]|uniref:ABC-type amino acid transport/signal transduction system, periplasmic component/domain protein n=1 Tax=Pseudoalteromonas luteoviolacea (strain 2ta16) TaxID=1353533 RepID=V4HTT9_PSEL2|nr:transporter substrate-binding domain-containing protein [Pseudoalteromonas luteoviolacea]ESP91309.1 ABC-type amino acid transport/signal transduction system, periplasmic component/domain protein [Pseudoalteromonas luteoviolacea 2ta16]